MIHRKINYVPSGELATEEFAPFGGECDSLVAGFPASSGPFFSHKDLLSNIPLPSILTDGTKMYYGSNESVTDFEDLLCIVEGRIVFKNRQMRERFSDFATKIKEINPKIFNIRETFSIIEYGVFKSTINLKSVNDMFDRNKILISIIHFEIDRVIDHAVLAELFGLTPAEGRLAAMLVNGKSVIECAEELGVRVSTVREQLSNLFAKTRTSRQPELVAMLSRLDLLV